MREIREEQAHEQRQLLKRAELDKEDLENKNSRSLKELEQLRRQAGERQQEYEGLHFELEQERQRCENLDLECHELRLQAESSVNEERARSCQALETLQALCQE